MEKRRTRGRPRRVEEPPVAITSTSRVSGQTNENTTARSPGRPPRPRPVASVNTINLTSDSSPIIIEDDKEEITISSTKSVNNLPTTLTTNTESHSTPKSFLTSSVFTSNSTTTQKVAETPQFTTILEDAFVEPMIRRKSASKELEIPVIRQRSVTPSTEARASRNSRSVSRSIFDDDDNVSRGGFSDQGTLLEEDEVDDPYESFRTAHYTSKPRMSSTKLFTLSIAISLMMILIPSLIYYLQWVCSKRVCAFEKPNWNGIMNMQYLLQHVFKTDIVVPYIAFFFTIITLSTLLPGITVRLYSERTQRLFNALTMALLLGIGFAVALYLKHPILKFVLSNYVSFCLYSLISTPLLAFWCYLSPLYVKDRKYTDDVLINTNGNTGHFFIDFSLGREINPKWFGIVDIKLTMRRLSLMTTLLLALCCLWKAIKLPTIAEETTFWNLISFYWNHFDYNKTMLFLSLLLLFYVSNAVFFERFMAASYELQAEGLGFLLLLRYAANPFLLAGPAIYFATHPQISIEKNYIFLISGMLFVVGLTIKTLSDAMKYKYRLDPLDPNFADVMTMPTFRGKRLLLGTFWGRLRHPNYTGELLILLSFALPVLFVKVWPPAVGLLLLITLLLHRVKSVSDNNSNNYNLSWNRYCDEVRYRIIPKVF